MSQYFIYHNPRCSKSRQTLALLQENQIETEQILYLENPPTVDTLSDLCEALGITPRQLLRKGETEYRELSLGNETLGDTEVLKAMRASHLFLMPSVQETFGLVYLEAMASGCVVIGHQGWGIDGVVEEGVNGYLVAAPTEAEIESKIQTYLVAQDREALHRESVKVANVNTRDSAVKNYRMLVGPS